MRHHIAVEPEHLYGMFTVSAKAFQMAKTFSYVALWTLYLNQTS